MGVSFMLASFESERREDGFSSRAECGNFPAARFPTIFWQSDQAQLGLEPRPVVDLVAVIAAQLLDARRNQLGAHPRCGGIGSKSGAIVLDFEPGATSVKCSQPHIE